MPSPLDRAEQAYHRAVFGGDPSELDSALDDLVGDAPKTLLARGRVLHARFLTDGVASGEELTCFDDALVGFRAEHDRTGEAQALFWQGCYWQVIARDEARAIGPLEAAAKLSAECGDDQTRSYALRHLGIAKHRSGDLGAARRLLEESTRLRRDLGFRAGVAANLIGLSYIATAEDRTEDAIRFADEASALAQAARAAAIVAQAEAARTAAQACAG